MLLIVSIITMALWAFLGYKKPGIALITLPIAMAVPPLYVDAYGPMELVYLDSIVSVLFIFLATLVAVLMSRREGDSRRWPQKCAKWILVSFVFLLLFAVVCVLFGVGGFIGFVFFTLFMASIISYGFGDGRQRAN